MGIAQTGLLCFLLQASVGVEACDNISLNFLTIYKKKSLHEAKI